MGAFTRRKFLRAGSIAAGLAGVGSLTLGDETGPTESSGGLGSYGLLLAQNPAPQIAAASLVPQPSGVWAPTEDNILGPFHRPGAPYRAKITPPLAPGKVLLIGGHVWAHDTKKPLAGAVLDVWQANDRGRYDNDDPNSPPQPGVFSYRARLITDENGYYEYETIHPAPYQIGANRWRPSHIHYLVRAPGYQQLITQLYFRGDKYNDVDQFIKKSLIIDVEPTKTEAGSFGRGTFDIVLAKA